MERVQTDSQHKVSDIDAHDQKPFTLFGSSFPKDKEYTQVKPTAYRPQRERRHVTAIREIAPSKIQIRQWFVTNYSNSCSLDCMSTID